MTFFLKQLLESRRKNKRWKMQIGEYSPINLNKKLSVKYGLSGSIGLKNEGNIKDISEGGLCLERKVSDVSLEKGTKLRLKILISDKDSKDIEVIGEVVWIDLKNSQYGIKFTSIYPDDRTKICRYIRDQYLDSHHLTKTR